MQIDRRRSRTSRTGPACLVSCLVACLAARLAFAQVEPPRDPPSPPPVRPGEGAPSAPQPKAVPPSGPPTSKLPDEPTAAPRRAGTLKLDQIIRLAIEKNERSRQADLRGVVAQGQVGRARAGFFPTLVASGNGTWTAQEDRNGRSFSSGGAITLTQPLIDAAVFPTLAQARHTRDAERWGSVEDRRTLAFDAARAFIQALTSERLVDAATRRQENAVANEEFTRARAEAGLASTNDVTRARIETTSASREVAQSKGTLARDYLDLGYIVGQAVEGNLAASETTTREAESGTFRVADVARDAEKRRPDVQEARARVEAADSAADEPLYRLAPTLDAQARVSFTVDPIAPDPGHAEQVSLNLNWVIFDAGVRYADRRSRKAALEIAALNEKLLVRSIGPAVGSAVASLEAAREAYKLAGVAVEAAQRNAEETQILYQQGLARAIELTDANLQRYSAEVSRETARLAMEQAYLELRFALGLDPTGSPIQNVAAAGGPGR